MTSRAQVIQEAVLKELSVRRDHIDKSTDLAEVQITVKLQAGSTWVRGIVWQEERIWRQVR